MGVSGEVAQHSGGDSGPISAQPASTPTLASDAPSDVSQHEHVDSVRDPHEPQQLKHTTGDVPIEASNDDIDEGGAKAVSEYISELQELQSRSNRETAEQFGVGITQDVPLDDPVLEGEDESVAGSLDVRTHKYLSRMGDC